MLSTLISILAIVSNRFLHFLYGPSLRMFPWCSKFKIFQRVVITDSVLMMHGESVNPEPKHRVFSHWMFFVKCKPMLVNGVALCKRMSSHSQDHNVSSGGFPYVPVASIFRQKRLFDTPTAECGNSLFCISPPKHSHDSTSRTFHLCSLCKNLSPTWMTHVFRTPYLAGRFIFMSTQHSFASASWTGDFPRSVSVRFRAPLNYINGQIKFFLHKSVCLICATLSASAEAREHFYYNALTIKRQGYF